MKINILSLVICSLLLVVFGVIWGSLDMYDTPKADIYIIPYWGSFVALCVGSVFLVKKLLNK